MAKTFPIRTVARLTGLTPDLIRAWERRYGVVSPIRGPRGARLYGADDVARLEQLARVVASGRSIGDVAHLPASELQTIAPAGSNFASSVTANGSEVPAVGELLEAIEKTDMRALEAGLGNALLVLGATDFARTVALPLLQAVGDRWQAGRLSIGQEHLVTAALRNLLGSLVRSRRDPGTASIVLASVQGERHEMGLLVVAMLAADQGLGVYLLGVDLPAEDIVATALQVEAQAVGLSFVAPDNRTAAVDSLRRVQAALPQHISLWVGGADAAHVAAGATDDRTLVLQDLELLLSQIRRLRQIPTFQQPL